MKHTHRSISFNNKNIIEIEDDIQPTILHINHHMDSKKNDVRNLAIELADALNDHEAILLYINFAEEYSEKLLREVLAKVLAIPKHKIRKTRGALFNYLMQQHAYKRNMYDRD